MSSRKRPLAEISQPHSTPSRYAPSTPHAIRALQQRSGAKTRSARSVRHTSADAVRPDSIRGVLRQFAKISAPVTKKRVATPTTVNADKENRNPGKEQDDDNDSVLLNKPNLTFAIEDSIEEEDSELPTAPTPSVLPDDDEDYDDPTITFQNVSRIPVARPASERSDRRRSRSLLLHGDYSLLDEDADQEGDLTIMTERGRRALSEEAIGRFSRYSFGSIQMGDFGTELEIRRDSTKLEKTAQLDIDDYVPLGGDDSINGGETEVLRAMQRYSSPASNIEGDTLRIAEGGNDSFQLDVPDDEQATGRRKTGMEASTSHAPKPTTSNLSIGILETDNHVLEIDDVETETSSRRQTLLETATTQAQASRRKRVKLTRHGTTVPSLPVSLVKRVVLDSYEKQSKRKPALGRDHVKALEQATEWFFEQVGEDLAGYSSHGRRRKRVDTDDVLLLMKRQKVLIGNGELRKMAKSWLPKDVLEGFDLPDSL